MFCKWQLKTTFTLPCPILSIPHQTLSTVQAQISNFHYHPWCVNAWIHLSILSNSYFHAVPRICWSPCKPMRNKHHSVAFGLQLGCWGMALTTGDWVTTKNSRSVMARQRACLCIRPLSPSWPQDRCSAQSTPIWNSAFLAHTLQWVFVAWCVFSCAHT